MIISKASLVFIISFVTGMLTLSVAQTDKEFRIVGYYSGPTALIDSFQTEQLTHLIFCFSHLEGNRLRIGSAADSATIKKMVELKHKNKELKVMLSLGGWGGCETCSDVFSTATGRNEFAQSVKAISAYFGTDGIDLDWEYPAIQGYPGHAFKNADRENFTALLKVLREVNVSDFQLSFAAGGFTSFIDSSVEWMEVIKYTDFINIMTYDLVHGYSTVSGHHTSLYSTEKQVESTDHAVQMLLEAGVPANQLVIGAAFYGRYFEIADGNPVDLYMPCRFSHALSSKDMTDSLSVDRGFEWRWDDEAQAPYAINVERRLVATYDDERSIALKTKYAVAYRLGGIMFWQLMDDKFDHGLLEVMYRNK